MDEAEQKNIIQALINKFFEVINLESFRTKISKYISHEYQKGLESAEVKFNMNFISREEDVKFLNNYVFDSMKVHTDAIGEALRGELQRGIMNKETISQLKKRVQVVFDDSKFTDRLKMVIRTERQRANNYGALEGARQSGLHVKKYIDIVNDSRTSNICLAEHKKYGSKDKAIPLDDDFVVRVDNKIVRAKAPPMHQNCRSVIRFIQVEE